MGESILRRKLFKDIPSLSMDKEELRRFLELIQERANSAYDLECKRIDRIDIDVKEKELYKASLKACSALKIRVTGHNNIELTGSIGDIFDSVSFPEKVKSVYVNSASSYISQFEYQPENYFELSIDFSRPKCFGFPFLTNEKTPNVSHIKVEGSDDIWVNGVFWEIESEFKNRESKFKAVHNGWLIWFFGIAVGLYMCYKLLPLIERTYSEYFVKIIFYLIVFILSIFVIRVLFLYFRWVYPLVEYRSKNERALIHKGALLSIFVGIIGKILYDLILLLLAL